MHAVGEWEECDELLPTLPGCVTGVVAKARMGKGQVVSVQCSTCLRVFTGRTIIALRSINFAPTPPAVHHEPFRRCADCREAGRLPEDADVLRGQQRCMERERQEIVRSDDYRKALRVESSIRSSPQEREIAYNRMVDMLKAADERGLQRWAEKCADSTPSLTARNAGQLPATG